MTIIKLKINPMKGIRKYIILLLLAPAAIIQAQPVGDSLTLSDVLNAVIANYPDLKRAEQDLVAADAKIGLTKTARLPDVAFSTGYNRMGPVTSFNFGGKNVQLSPENMYNATFSVSENLYDFGKTSSNLAVDEKSKEMVQTNMDQARQRLSMAVMGNFYTISYIQEAIRIKDDQLKNLNDHLEFIQKKEASGSATQYDILSTKVRISAVENQKTDLLTALEVQICQMNSFLGRPQNSALALKKEIRMAEEISSVDSLCSLAFANRYEMIMAGQKEEISQLKLNAIKAQNNPSLNFQAQGGYKNGYFNKNMEDIGKFNYIVGVGLKVPIFDANRTKFAKMQANADIQGRQQETELIRRNITNEVVESRVNALAAQKKIKQSELQVQQATQAYNLAEVSYKAGAITNLDLLDSYTALSESKLALYKTRIDYSVSMQKLKIALGEKIY
jgi:outer membrane protein